MLDACLAQDNKSKVACETATKTGMVMILGEITTKAQIDYQEVIREAVRKVSASVLVVMMVMMWFNGVVVCRLVSLIHRTRLTPTRVTCLLPSNNKFVPPPLPPPPLIDLFVRLFVYNSRQRLRKVCTKAVTCWMLVPVIKVTCTYSSSSSSSSFLHSYMYMSC